MKSKVSSKAKAIEEKVKIAELLAEAELMEKKWMIEMQAERLHMQEKVAKAQAKFKIYEDLDHKRQGRLKSRKIREIVNIN